MNSGNRSLKSLLVRENYSKIQNCNYKIGDSKKTVLLHVSKMNQENAIKEFINEKKSLKNPLIAKLNLQTNQIEFQQNNLKKISQKIRAKSSLLFLNSENLNSLMLQQKLKLKNEKVEEQKIEKQNSKIPNIYCHTLPFYCSEETFQNDPSRIRPFSHFESKNKNSIYLMKKENLVWPFSVLQIPTSNSDQKRKELLFETDLISQKIKRLDISKKKMCFL